MHILFSAATRKGHCILPSVYHQSIYNIKEPFAYQLKIAIVYNLLYSNKRMLIWTIAGHRSLSLLEIVWTPSNTIIFALCFTHDYYNPISTKVEKGCQFFLSLVIRIWWGFLIYMLFTDSKILSLIKGTMLFFVTESFGGKVSHPDTTPKVIGRFF